jgi:tetratricopeptide (TPR) repeat protein
LKGASNLSTGKVRCLEGLFRLYSEEYREEVGEILQIAVEADSTLEEAYEGLVDWSLSAPEDSHGHTRYALALEWCRRGYEADKGYWPHLIRSATIELDWANTLLHHEGEAEPLLDKALSCVEKVLSMKSDQGEALLVRATLKSVIGNLKANQGKDPTARYDESKADFERAKELLGDVPLLFQRRAESAIQWGNHELRSGRDPRKEYEQAVVDCERLLAAEPLNWRMTLAMANALGVWAVVQGRFGEDPEQLFRRAIQACANALALDPKNGIPHISAAENWLRWGDWLERQDRDPREAYESAIGEAGHALKFYSRSVEPLKIRAAARQARQSYARTKLGETGVDDYKLALGDFNRVVGLSPGSAEAYWKRGVCRALLEDYEGAQKDFERAKALDPATEPAFAPMWKLVKEKLEGF